MASNQTSTILLRGGTVLVHEGNKVNALPEYDVLIEGGRISQIGQELDVPEGGTVLSCYHKIVSPGFIDTHHHLWQSQLKGRHGDQSFMAYMVAGNFQSYNYTSDDIFWGQLAGSLESIDGGVTTVVDHAHMTYSPEHATAAIRATASSGLRSVFCYSLISRFKDWTESTIEIDEEKIPDWWAQTLSSLAQLQPFGEGRVSLGLGFDVFSLPKEKIINLYKTARNLGVKLITSHYVAGRIPDIPQFLAENGILGKDVLLSHACGISEMNATLLQQNEAYVSSTPDTELQMGVGEPIAFRDDIKPIASIGVDCHANNSSDILTQIRISLQHARGTHNASASQARQYPSIQIKLEEAFNLGTIQGAKAINQEHEIGSIEIGKRADIVIFDTRSPSMVCAAEENPLAAIILHASVRDIDTVIIDGKIRKQAGRLADTELYNQLNESSGEIVSWEQVVDHLLKSRVHIKEKGEDQNIQLGMGAVSKIW
ncbi:hypothetical protein OIDMADRAFT_100147 [Oidiodendron maius Zn]|uniref:Amidohydrolase-related domain-containing protein n=1 Tax=Oidiodendron maius (strain Zn) TaxID=913774 RepID=A0A0C3DAF0_OIDMZ|nr:hypothetical protein OIDMADRAFT_100147 [Oidiodendron maius Zn]